MTYRYWLPNEDRLLKDMASTSTSTEIAATIGRSRDAVKHRAMYLRISLRKHGEKCSWAKYSDAVCETARCMHEAGKKPQQIAIDLNIPISACRDFVYFKRGFSPQAAHQ